MNEKIVFLADYPEHLNTIAKWYWEEWDRHEGWNYERSYQFAQNGCNKDQLDIILVALSQNDECIGTIQLRNEWGIGEEIPDKLKKYSPWLGSLYVKKEYRGGKIAHNLCDALENVLTNMNITRFYAATGHLDSFFKAKKGIVIDDIIFANEQMRIFEFSTKD